MSFRANVSPSTVTGIEVSGQDQPFGQNAYSRTSQQTYRDVAGVFQDTWTIGTNKVNEFRFQYARRGLVVFLQHENSRRLRSRRQHYRLRLLRPRALLLHSARRAALPVHRQFFLDRRPPQHEVRRRRQLPSDLPRPSPSTTAASTISEPSALRVSASSIPSPTGLPNFPDLSAVQAYGAGLPGDFIQGIGSPSDSFHNIPIGAFWQDSWRVTPHVTLNYGLRYDVEIPPTFKSPQGLALPAYRLLGLQKGIQTDTNNIQPRIGMAWDPAGNGKTVVRASYGMFYDHPLLGLYFLGDASDGSSSGQLAFAGTSVCSGAGNPGNLNAITIFQGLPINVPSAANPCAATLNPATASALGYLPNQQQFQALNFPQSVFLNQNYLNSIRRSCRWDFSLSAIRSRRISSTPTRSRPTSRSSAIWATDSLSASPTTSTADATSTVRSTPIRFAAI